MLIQKQHGTVFDEKQKRNLEDKAKREKGISLSPLEKMERKQVSPIIVSHSSLSCFLKGSRHRIKCYQFHVSLETSCFESKFNVRWE